MESLETYEITSKQAISLAMDVGEVMITCGAETYRAEDTMLRIIKKCGYEAESFVTLTGIFACVRDSGNNPKTMIKRISSRSYDLIKLTMANDLSRNFVEGRISYEEAASSLLSVKDSKAQYRNIVKIIAAGVGCGCFSYMLSYSVPDAISSFSVGMAVQFTIIHTVKLPSLLLNLIGGALIALLSTTFAVIGLGENIDKIIIGAVLPLLPGVAFTNSLRDIVVGDFLSGTSRLMEAVITTIGIVTGVGVVLQFVLCIFGGLSA